MGRTRRPGIGRPRVGRPHVGIHTVGVTHHDRKTHQATPSKPPAYAPPVTTEANGSVRVPVNHRALAWHSRFTKGCLWNAELLDIFGPRNIGYVHLQSSIELPDLLRRSGIDQEEFGTFARRACGVGERCANELKYHVCTPCGDVDTRSSRNMLYCRERVLAPDARQVGGQARGRHRGARSGVALEVWRQRTFGAKRAISAHADDRR